jgi:two-component system alkaline phosphatase synthesis response regulator PhoP
VPKKILVVEDSATALALISEALGRAGYESVSAINGEEGVQKAKEVSPDLAIIDTLLPDSDGFEVCRKVKDALDPDKVKVIIMTGSVDAIDAVKARHCGADDFCVKTQDMSVLIKCVDGLIGGGKDA